MLRIAISCGEGFSSGFLAHHLQEQVIKDHATEEVSFVRIPFPELKERQNEVDIAMIMPHIEWKIKDAMNDFQIPLYVIPFKVAIKPTYRDFLEDAQDIISLSNGKHGLFAFPDEPKTNDVVRLVSHRTWTNNAAHASL